MTNKYFIHLLYVSTDRLDAKQFTKHAWTWSSESSGMYCRVLNWISTDVSEVQSASIIRAMMMEAARTSEMSVDIQLRTWQYIPEDSELHTHRRENLKSHMLEPDFATI
jgi:hypothetical protein